MAKEKPSTESEEKRLKRDKKKEKKRSETEGVHKSSSSKHKDKSEKKKEHKKDRREKKSSSSKTEEGNGKTPLPTNTTSEDGVAVQKANDAAAEDVQMTTELLNSLEKEKPGSVAVVKDGDVDGEGDVLEVKVKNAVVGRPLLIGALVPFAHPLADEKVGKKVLKGVKRAAKNKTLKRGVKEVVKALRKSPSSTTSTTSSLPTAVVVLAADISPMDVISHLPVLCEDHGIPYVFVTSRVELGAAGSTKRPTSVVMISRDKGGKDRGKGKEGKEGEEMDEGEGWDEVYADLVKVVVKAAKGVRV